MNRAVSVKLVSGKEAFSALLALGALLLVLLPRTALADVRLDGEWPATDKLVSLDANHMLREEAVKRLADAAGWSVVMSSGSKEDEERVDIHVKDQPATKVLALVLADGSFVARRQGSLVSLRVDEGDSAAPSTSAAPPAPPPPPVAPAPPAPPAMPSRRGEDRTVTGGSLKIRSDEVVHDVSVFGGSVDVYGTVTGDLAVMGGRAEVHDGAHIVGSATTVGGSLRIRDGARVDGDVGVVGGSLRRDDKAQVGGSIVHGTMNDEEDDDDEHDRAVHGDHASHRGKGGPGFFAHAAEVAGEAFLHAGILFVFGTIVLALASKRVETLRVEVASRPMRSFALGVVGLIGAIALVVALCVTIAGIPVAIVGVLAGAVAMYVGVVAVVTTLGEALLRHRTKNPYVHLAVGCAILLVLGAVPWVGAIAKAFVAFAGIGVLVATRAAGLVPARSSAPGAYTARV